METGAIVFIAAFVAFVIVFIAFTSYSKENEELVGGMLCNMLIDREDKENKKRMELQAKEWIEQMRIVSNKTNLQEPNFPIGGTFSKSKHEDVINNNSKLPLIEKLGLLNIELSKEIKRKRMDIERENEFNNDCA